MLVNYIVSRADHSLNGSDPAHTEVDGKAPVDFNKSRGMP